MHSRTASSANRLPFSVVLLAVAVRLLPTGAAEPQPPTSSPPIRLTRDGDFKQHLQWSPDGKRFLFTRIHQGKMALWTMAADGAEMKRLLPDLDQPHFDGHWSADGKRIVYVHDQL